MSPNFRPVRPEEIPDVARLAAHSFPGVGRSLPDWELSVAAEGRGGLASLWVGEEGGRLVAACHLYPFRQWIGGELLPIMGLGTVAIAPTHRRRGLAGQLVASGLRHSRERGDLASALYPFRTSFYQRLGYGMAGEAYQFQVPPEVIPDAPERRNVVLVRGEVDRASMRAVYDAWAPGQTGQLERNDHAWRRLWEGRERSAVLYLSEAREPQGYALFGYHHSPGQTGRGLDVEEIVWLTPAARRGLHGWLSSLGDQWQYILYRAHPEEAFAERLRDLRFPPADTPRWGHWFHAASLMMGPMFRLVDLPAALKARRVPPDSRITLGLEVEDEQIGENGGSWRLRLEGGRVTVERGAGPTDAVLSLRIDVLSRIFIGALAPSVAVEGDRARIDRPELLPALDRALRLPRPWTFDRF